LQYFHLELLNTLKVRLFIKLDKFETMLQRTAIQLISAIVLFGLFAQPLLIDGLRFNTHHSGNQKVYKSQKQISFLFDENEENTEDTDNSDDLPAAVILEVLSITFCFVQKEPLLLSSYNKEPHLYQSRSLWLINRTLIR